LYELKVNGLTRVFSNGREKNVVLKDLNFAVEKNQFVSIIGPSGCGKTTLLNIIAGFLRPTSGKVMVGETEVSGPGPDRAFVFQNYALFPWMTVKDNITYPMRLQKIPRAEQTKQLQKLLTLAHLEGKEGLFPHQLSGGMKQRTGVIRALACHPRVLLMDEPLGAVDMQMRQKLQEDIQEIFLRDTVTVIMITHDIDEAVFLSDRILVMSPRQGKIEADRKINLERPRIRRTSQYHEIIAELTEVLHNTYEERGAEETGLNYSGPANAPLFKAKPEETSGAHE
jgi:NitT/TauT family transport system ATP-binding protein